MVNSAYFSTESLAQLYMESYANKTEPLFDHRGNRNRGSSTKNAFWNGYDGQPNLTFPEGSFGYIAYRIGQDVREAEWEQEDREWQEESL